MDSKQILKADFLDLVFDTRNKDYGAYELRRHYNRRIAKALIITGATVGFTLAGAALANKRNPQQIAQQKKKDIIVHIIDDTPKPPQTEIPEPKPQELTPVRQEIFTTPRITDEEVEEPMATQNDLDSALIGSQQIDGPVDVGIQQTIAEAVGGGKDIIEAPPKKDDEPYITVQVNAEFIGNWEKFLRRYLNGNVPIDNDARPGRYHVVIQFVVDTDGSISDIKALTNVGYGMEEEAMRVIRKATKWKPAIQNGHPVKAYRKQPITFEVGQE